MFTMKKDDKHRRKYENKTAAQLACSLFSLIQAFTVLNKLLLSCIKRQYNFKRYRYEMSCGI